MSLDKFLSLAKIGEKLPALHIEKDSELSRNLLSHLVKVGDGSVLKIPRNRLGIAYLLIEYSWSFVLHHIRIACTQRYSLSVSVPRTGGLRAKLLHNILHLKVRVTFFFLSRFAISTESSSYFDIKGKKAQFHDASSETQSTGDGGFCGSVF